MGNNISYEASPIDLDLGTKGKIRGTHFSSESGNSCRFAGVPYALPPTGQYRWRKPRPLPSSFQYAAEDGTAYNATAFKPVCYQEPFSGASKAEGKETQYSEDCLLLNIWTPIPNPGEESKKFPVVIWLHGGWFAMGDPSQELGMDPTELISTGGLDAIFIAVGYRLNIFGFLSGSALLDESKGSSAGNYGLWDVRLAMEWVHDYIHCFGGNPSNVTLGGRSAGAYVVEAQVLHELRRPKSGVSEEELLKRFYMISNAIPAQPKTVEECEPQFEEVCAYFKVPSELSGSEKLEQLRAVPPQDLVSALKHLANRTFRPVTDDLIIHSSMTDYLTSGTFATDFKTHGFKVMIGEVLNEETLYSVYHAPESGTLEALRTQVGNYYAPATVDRILPHYELPDSDDLQLWRKLYGTIIADGQARAPSRFFVENLQKFGVPLSDIWRYQIKYRLSFITDAVCPDWMGVAHATDKPIWNFSIAQGPTAEERQLMEDWISNLVAFVNDDPMFTYGTSAIDDVKVMTPEGKIEIEKDTRWDELAKLGALFADGGEGSEDHSL